MSGISQLAANNDDALLSNDAKNSSNQDLMDPAAFQVKSSKDNTESVSTIKETVDEDEGENTPEKEQKNSEVYCRKKPKKRKAKRLHMTFKRPRITSDETASQTKYFFENGLRKVVPYDHKFNTFCKGRWIGKTLREIYTKEFRLYPVEYYEKAIKDGCLLVNLERPHSLDHVVNSNDLISSVVHRHECPVTDSPISIIADDDDFFVINKPCSIPLHPGGRFRHNTVISILAKEFNQKSILSIHRLDRMTSGLLMFVKTKEVATRVHSQIRERKVEKEYVCRVVGDFSKFALADSQKHLVKIEGHDPPEVTISEPLKVYDPRIGTTIVSRDEDAKHCETVFRCLSTNGKESVVGCKPKTGRTHQIRVHLQYLGYPITNDPVYNSPAWGDDRFKLGPITKPLKTVMEELSCMKKWQSIIDSAAKTYVKDGMSDGEQNDYVDKKSIPNSEASAESQPDSGLARDAVVTDGIVAYRSNCEECKHPLPDPTPEELIMYLHALRYKGPDWQFETPLPEWAEEGWVKDKSASGT